jgi:glycosyltransferase involved in cell wall biosynthesis
MRVAILRREPSFSFSMDVYANEVVAGLRSVRPNWEVHEFLPQIKQNFAGPSPFWARGLAKYYERYWHYPRLLQDLDYDLFHIIDHSDGHLVYWLQKTQKTTIVTCHDLINLLQPETFKGKAYFQRLSLLLWKWAIHGLRYANHVVTVSSHTAAEVSCNLQINTKNISVVPNAVNKKFHLLSSKENFIFREQNGISSTTLCLLNVGSNNIRKNLDSVLELLLRLKTNGFPVQLWKAGSDFNSTQKQFLQANNLVQDVIYFGEPSDSTLVKLYNAADILVAPSLYEGFGMTILEAMACGTPVITSNTTSLPEVAGDAAILVDPLDISAMFEAVSRLRGDPHFYQSFIVKGFERSQQFTWEKTAEKLAKIYEQVS